METKQVSKKICLLGDPAVGKTSLIHRYVYDVFEDKYLSTIGAKITKKTNIVEIPEANVNVELTLIIWDITGQKMFHSVHYSYYKGVEAVLAVADITRSETFDNITSWLSEVFKVAQSVPVLILANKYDLKEQAEISDKEIAEKMAAMGASYLFTSAKSGENVEKAFRSISKFLSCQTFLHR